MGSTHNEPCPYLCYSMVMNLFSLLWTNFEISRDFLVDFFLGILVLDLARVLLYPMVQY
uniref:Uncharacterized protein n=1 Tax=Nelumbo nucifera TaxID=4432 RepID=A0A822Y2K6_NELNU|nr:TPA_asm: hypothetical protein HUJ06_026950 [Nelumbo nucifera]DAD25488.1 TPA_asm: hypothetical protein HUJ06_026953 [Nelumbo nucifera]DAD25573.1 TPA_asm: hypothetical protein HUJ06_027037 [Nelumbo nucifera]